ncbi:hypothetical protein VCHA53O466_40185 [Vibrio chagasii]|nr:hypothetical protein VCHA53O466_40185 [Vibrio chagasii]
MRVTKNRQLLLDYLNDSKGVGYTVKELAWVLGRAGSNIHRTLSDLELHGKVVSVAKVVDVEFGKVCELRMERRVLIIHYYHHSDKTIIGEACRDLLSNRWVSAQKGHVYKVALRKARMYQSDD